MAIPSDDNMSDLISNPEDLCNLGDLTSYVDGNNSFIGNFESFSNILAPEQTLDLKQEIMLADYPPQSLNLPENQQPFENTLPPVFYKTPSVCNDDYAGPHNFDVYVVPNDSKNPWVYSTLLNKVFIDMNASFPVEFRLSSRPIDEPYIRVMPCFSSLQHSQDLVFRCVQHEQPQFNKNVHETVRQHIIRVYNERAQYLGNKDFNERLSILFPLKHPQIGAEAVREMFVFVCKNSCPSGMNRKPIEIIFTLEKFDGTVLGRRVLNVRICSCPKRDKEKEEKDENNKGAPNQSKKRKLQGKHEKGQSRSQTMSNSDADRNIHSVTLEIAGKHNVQQVLKYAQDLMAGEILRHPQNNEAFKACFKNLQEQSTTRQQ